LEVRLCFAGNLGLALMQQKHGLEAHQSHMGCPGTEPRSRASSASSADRRQAWQKLLICQGRQDPGLTSHRSCLCAQFKKSCPRQDGARAQDIAGGRSCRIGFTDWRSAQRTRRLILGVTGTARRRCSTAREGARCVPASLRNWRTDHER
jgi:hypothetical protein